MKQNQANSVLSCGAVKKKSFLYPRAAQRLTNRGHQLPVKVEEGKNASEGGVKNRRTEDCFLPPPHLLPPLIPIDTGGIFFWK